MATTINASNTAGLITTADTSSILQLQTANTTAVTIDASQNVGIGVTPSAWASPFKALDVNTIGGYAASTSTVNVLFNAYNDGSWKYKTTGYATRLMQGDSGQFAWYTAPSGTAGTAITFTQAMTLDTSGNLLVGTTSTVAGGRAAFWSSTAVTAAEFRVNAASSDGTQAITLIKNSTTNTTSQVLANFAINNGSTGSGQINANGASQAAFGSFSDARLKTNVVDLQPQLQNILSLRPVEFDYIESEGGGHQISFIAQEFENVYPDAVGERADGMKTLTGWGKTEARLVKAIQEQQALIQTLTARIEALEGAK